MNDKQYRGLMARENIKFLLGYNDEQLDSFLEMSTNIEGVVSFAIECAQDRLDLFGVDVVTKEPPRNPRHRSRTRNKNG